MNISKDLFHSALAARKDSGDPLVQSMRQDLERRCDALLDPDSEEYIDYQERRAEWWTRRQGGRILPAAIERLAAGGILIDERYTREAVEIFGKNHVCSNFIIGLGESDETVEKGIKDARKNMVAINLKGNTIPHRIETRRGASKVLLIPASEGTGVIAGVHLRPLLELAGIRDVLTKTHGSTNPKNLVAAGMQALRALRTKDMVAKLRGVEL